MSVLSQSVFQGSVSRAWLLHRIREAALGQNCFSKSFSEKLRTHAEVIFQVHVKPTPNLTSELQLQTSHFFIKEVGSDLSRHRHLNEPLQPDRFDRQAHRHMQRALQKAFSQQLANTANYRLALTLASHRP